MASNYQEVTRHEFQGEQDIDAALKAARKDVDRLTAETGRRHQWKRVGNAFVVEGYRA